MKKACGIAGLVSALAIGSVIVTTWRLLIRYIQHVERLEINDSWYP